MVKSINQNQENCLYNIVFCVSMVNSIQQLQLLQINNLATCRLVIQHMLMYLCSDMTWNMTDDVTWLWNDQPTSIIQNDRLTSIILMLNSPQQLKTTLLSITYLHYTNTNQSHQIWSPHHPPDSQRLIHVLIIPKPLHEWQDPCQRTLIPSEKVHANVFMTDLWITSTSLYLQKPSDVEGRSVKINQLVRA